MRFILTLLFALFCAPHPAAASAPRRVLRRHRRRRPRSDRTRPDGHRGSWNPPDQPGVGRRRVRAGRAARLEPLRHPDRRRRGARASACCRRCTARRPGRRRGISIRHREAHGTTTAASYGRRPPVTGTAAPSGASIRRSPACRSTDWQLWNEPNLQGFWLPKLSAKSYVALLRVFSRAIHSGDPDCARPARRALSEPDQPRPRHRDPARAIPLDHLPAEERQEAVRRRRHPSVRHHSGPRPGRREAHPR